MDSLLLTWILQHSMKHSFTRVIQEISQGEPLIEYQPSLQPYVLYATCSKLLSNERNGGIEDRKMLYAALEKFMESMPSISEHEISKNYSQLLCILKWTNRAQFILENSANSVGNNDMPSLRKMREAFETDWNALAIDATHPLYECFQDIIAESAEGTSSISSAFSKLLAEFSFHVVSLLGICIAVMQSLLPPSGVEQMLLHQTYKSSRAEVTVLPMDGFERFNCVSSMIKEDSSEKGLLTVVKLIHQMPLSDSKNADVPGKIQGLAAVNASGREVLNAYRKRLHYYKGILRSRQKGYLISPFSKAAKLSKRENQNIDSIASSTTAELDDDIEPLVLDDAESTHGGRQNKSDEELEPEKDNLNLISDCEGRNLVFSEEKQSSQTILEEGCVAETLTENELFFSCEPDPLCDEEMCSERS